MNTIRVISMLLLLFISQVRSQQNSSESVLGIYKNQISKDAHFSESIILSGNNNATYKLQYKFGTLDLSGKWTHLKDTIALDFKMPPEKIEGKVSGVFYGKKKREQINLTVQDSIGLLLGSVVFIDEKKYEIKSENTILKAIFIKEIRVLYQDEIYVIDINKLVNTDIKIQITLPVYRGMIYDLIKTKWLLQKDKLLLLKGSIIDKNYFLQKQ